MQLIGQWLETNLQSDEVAYVVSPFYNHATVLAHNVDHSRVRWLMTEHLILPPQGTSALYLFPRTAYSLFYDTLVADEHATRLHTSNGPDGAPAFTAYRMRSAQGRVDVPKARFADLFISADVRSLYSGRGGETVSVLLAWDVQRTPERADLTPVIVLHDPFGEEVARFHPYFEQSDRLRAGERLLMAVNVPIPLGAPRGTYTLRTTWISRANGAPLPLVDAENRFSGLWSEAARIVVQPSAPRKATPQGAAVLPSLHAALSAPPQATEQGDWLRFTVTWQATEAPKAQPDLVLTAQPANGAPIRLWQGQPVRNTYPFSAWRADEYLVDRYAVRLPPDLPAGNYTVRLSLADRTVFETPLTVIGVARRYDTPDLPPCNFRFGAQIGLIGCQVERSGDAVHVRLAWRALATPEADFTATVQALNADGTLFSQHDAPPAARPTTRWLPDEVFESSHTLKVPLDGTLRLIVALYTPEDGRRLPVYDATDKLIGDSAPLTGE
ncbi:MAG: hypothetical protein NZ571_09935 [Anaerolineae bacterium]|nr:hypothetical protein [Anaerolineae bacterium]